MKPILLALAGLSATSLTLAAPTFGQRNPPPYATAVAAQVCAYMRSGHSFKDASALAIRKLWSVYGNDILRDTTAVAARKAVEETYAQCPELR